MYSSIKWEVQSSRWPITSTGLILWTTLYGSEIIYNDSVVKTMFFILLYGFHPTYGLENPEWQYLQSLLVLDTETETQRFSGLPKVTQETGNRVRMRMQIIWPKFSSLLGVPGTQHSGTICSRIFYNFKKLLWSKSFQVWFSFLFYNFYISLPVKLTLPFSLLSICLPLTGTSLQSSVYTAVDLNTEVVRSVWRIMDLGGGSLSFSWSRVHRLRLLHTFLKEAQTFISFLDVQNKLDSWMGNSWWMRFFWKMIGPGVICFILLLLSLLWTH